MQVKIPSGSPLLNYRPCRDCDPTTGWTAASTNGSGDGSDSGWLTSAELASVSLNITGTGVQFDIAFSGGPWRSDIKVNGTNAPEVNATVNMANMAVNGLPDGTHLVELTITRPADKSGEETWARVSSATELLSYMQGNTTTNVTVDDTQWASEEIALSPAWNMMEQAHSNWINDIEYYDMRKTADRNFNSSLSWTTEEGANNTVKFEGSAVWVYGLSGGEAGLFEVVIDNVSRGTFDPRGGSRVYNQTLYHTSGLGEGTHTLSLVNRGGRLSFDYLVSLTGLVPAPKGNMLPGLPFNASTASATPSQELSLFTNSGSLATVPVTTAAGPTKIPKADSTVGGSSENIKTIVGASVGAVAGLLFLTLLGYLIWSCCRRRKQDAQRRKSNHPRGWEDDKPHRTQGKGWQFINLPDGHTSSEAKTQNHLQTPRRQDAHTSGSSFGSAVSDGVVAESVVAPFAVAHTRRSALPFKNNLFGSSKEKRPQTNGQNHNDLGPVDDDPVPISWGPPGSRASTASPNPMLAALGGAGSPLTELQRNCSIDAGQPHAYGSAQGRSDGPKVGTYEWYNWFGLGAASSAPPSGDQQNIDPSPKRRLSGFSNMFRRSAATSKLHAEGATEQAHNMVHLEGRPSERSPPRRLFGKAHDDGDTASMKV